MPASVQFKVAEDEVMLLADKPPIVLTPIVATALDVQLCASVTVAVYEPGASAVAVAAVCTGDEFHEYV